MLKTDRNPELRLTMKPGVGIILLIALMIFGLTVTSFVTQLLMKMSNLPAALRIGSVIQDLLVFILPAIATAMLATRLPARFLRIEKKPDPRLVFLGILILVFAMPAINFIVEWNNSISLPESMSSIEETMRMLEKNAETTISSLMGGTSIGALIISVLIVGFLAGFSEEIFFRGAMQRLFGFAMDRNVAIFITAFIFSAIHLQFYGFFPRFLLGLLFGYLFWWSGSLVVPVAAHIFNNSMVVIVKWMMNCGIIRTNLDNFGAEGGISDIIGVIVSVIATAITVFYFYKLSRKNV